MSLLDKAIAAITPPESEEERAEARDRAERLAPPGSWFAEIIGHHREIEAQFARVKGATDATSRAAEQAVLGELLTGHSLAEEAAVYPAMAAEHQVAHAELAYQEQSAAKMELGLLERLDPLSEDYLDKLEHIRGAVAHHIYSEEGTWFPELLRTAGAAEHDRIARRYNEEYRRYSG